MNFPHSRKKVERALKHIHDLNELVNWFSASNFYSVTVQQQKGSNIVAVAIFRHFPVNDGAVIIGDALHNLRSALDLMYYRAFNGITAGMADKWTRFPIRDERKELISSINGGLEKKKLLGHYGALKLRDFIVDDVRAYQAGNWPLWVLHDMNIRDKHELLIPVFKIMRFTDISLKDENGNVFPADVQPYFTEDSYWFRLRRSGKFEVHEKGHAATAILFGTEVPLNNQPVIPAITDLAENVTRTIDAFEALDISGFSE